MSLLTAILGAGRAKRFGADKLAQPCNGKPLGQWALEAAQALHEPLVWIAGDSTPSFVTCEVALNPKAMEGIGTSVALAARLAQARDAQGLLILLADMPLVTPDLLHHLIVAGAPAACRQADGRPGVPALLPPETYAALAALAEDRGAGPVLAALTALTLIDAEPHALLDVDTPEALAEAEALLS